MRGSNADAAMLDKQCTQAMPVRTDGRTNEEPSHLTGESAASVTRGRTYGMSSLAESMGGFADALEVAQKRDVIERVGERAPIPGWVRAAIHVRDGWRCQWCSTHIPGFDAFTERVRFELDHIKPWSAGGSDRSDNLRTLCNHCNEGRSNFQTDAYVRVIPVGVCDACTRRKRARAWPPVEPFEPDCEPVTVFCYWCHLAGPATESRRIA